MPLERCQTIHGIAFVLRGSSCVSTLPEPTVDALLELQAKLKTISATATQTPRADRSVGTRELKTLSSQIPMPASTCLSLVSHWMPDNDRLAAAEMRKPDLLDNELGYVGMGDDPVAPLCLIVQHTMLTARSPIRKDAGPHDEPIEIALLDQPLLSGLVVVSSAKQQLER